MVEDIGIEPIWISCLQGRRPPHADPSPIKCQVSSFNLTLSLWISQPWFCSALRYSESWPSECSIVEIRYCLSCLLILGDWHQNNLANNFTKYFIFESSPLVILSYCSASTDSTFLFNIFEVSLVPRILSRICWCLRLGLNQWPSDFQSDTLPTELHKHIKIWGKRRDSNSRSSEPQSDVLGQLHYSHHKR